MIDLIGKQNSPCRYRHILMTLPSAFEQRKGAIKGETIISAHAELNHSDADREVILVLHRLTLDVMQGAPRGPHPPRSDSEDLSSEPVKYSN